MMIKLEAANRIVAAALAMARELKLSPITICVLDRGGHVVSAQREDDSSILRFEIAFGKAWASLGVGHSSRFLQDTLAKQRPRFVDAMAAASNGRFIPVAGGVLVREPNGTLIGAVGVTGDSADNDEKIAVTAIEQCGFTADLA
jgi:uncharacterized protein GlcG (DUF336 family)